MKTRVQDLAYLIAFVLGVLLLVSLVGIWCARIWYPYDLEWMEGGMLVHAWRIDHGLPIYSQPSADFIPYLYTPGYPALLAGLSQLFELDYLLGRALSLLSVFAAACAIGHLVCKRNESRMFAFLSATVFLGCYASSGAFFDLVRSDGLHIGFLSWAIVIALRTSKRAVAASGLLLALAWSVKQQAVFYGLPIAIALWVRDDWKSALRFTLWAAVPAATLASLLSWATDGRFLSYTIEVAASHPIVIRRAFVDAPLEWGSALPVAIACGTLCLAWTVAGARRSGDGDGRPSWQWIYAVGILITAIVISGWMRAHHGGFANVLIPLFWATCAGFGISAATIKNHVAPKFGAVLGATLFALQLALQWWQLEPARYKPTRDDRLAGDQFVEELRKVQGPVWSPIAPWLPVQGGHDPSFHLISLWDLSYQSGPFPDALDKVAKAIGEGYWRTIVTGDQRLPVDLAGRCKDAKKIITNAATFRPKTGWKAHPTHLCTE